MVKKIIIGLIAGVISGLFGAGRRFNFSTCFYLLV